MISFNLVCSVSIIFVIINLIWFGLFSIMAVRIASSMRIQWKWIDLRDPSSANTAYHILIKGILFEINRKQLLAEPCRMLIKYLCQWEHPHISVFCPRHKNDSHMFQLLPFLFHELSYAVHVYVYLPMKFTIGLQLYLYFFLFANSDLKSSVKFPMIILVIASPTHLGLHSLLLQCVALFS